MEQDNKTYGRDASKIPYFTSVLSDDAIGSLVELSKDSKKLKFNRGGQYILSMWVSDGTLQPRVVTVNTGDIVELKNVEFNNIEEQNQEFKKFTVTRMN